VARSRLDDVETIQGLMALPTALELYAISKAVNDVKNNGPDCSSRYLPSQLPARASDDNPKNEDDRRIVLDPESVAVLAEHRERCEQRARGLVHDCCGVLRRWRHPLQADRSPECPLRIW
jgi:hypothetical protein